MSIGKDGMLENWGPLGQPEVHDGTEGGYTPADTTSDETTSEAENTPVKPAEQG